MGLSWIGPGGFNDLIVACHACQPPYVVIGNESKASQALRLICPDTEIHFRITGHDRDMPPTRQGGADRVRWLLPVFRDSQAHILSIANEWLPSGDNAEQLA